MSIESLNQLEEKVQSAIETISLYRMEIEELKEARERTDKENQELRSLNTKLEDEVGMLKKEHQSWGDKVSMLLGKLDSLTEEEVA